MGTGTPVGDQVWVPGLGECNPALDIKMVKVQLGLTTKAEKHLNGAQMMSFGQKLSFGNLDIFQPFLT